MRFGSIQDGRDTGWTPLMFAVVAKRVDLVEALLDAGADASVRFRKGFAQFGMRKDMPVLHAACATHDCPEIVQLLIARGADPFKKMPMSQAGKPVVHQATGFGHVGNLDALHAAGGDKLLTQKDLFGFTLMQSCAYAHEITRSVDHVLALHQRLVLGEHVVDRSGDFVGVGA